ncbi:MAG: thermonuclease family protein [Phycisphaerae bacterium]|nr:thermonuclease family protein [Phycisphaerae bacterium]NUQ44648.1 thermonuclease family protein [Phycisphaerae bacterium]
MTRKRNKPHRQILSSVIALTAVAFAFPPAAWARDEIVGTQGSEVYHTRDCVHARRISDTRRVKFASEDDAIRAGRRKCKTCARLEETTPLRGAPQSKPAEPVASRPAASPPATQSQPTSSPSTQRATGRVVEVIDARTFRIGGVSEKVRLIGVVSPGADCPLGAAAKRYVEELALGREVVLEDDPANAKQAHMDRSGRRLAYVRVLNGDDVGAALIGAGHGWPDSQRFDRRQTYAEAEKSARAARRGLWSPLPSPSGATLVQRTAKGVTYHPQGCTHLRRTAEPLTLTVNEAREAGCRPCSLWCEP